MHSDHNQLLSALGPKARNSLVAIAETTHLEVSEVLCESGSTVRHVYFPVDGIISLVTASKDSPALEVGMIGPEGMLGASLALGVPVHPVRAVVQGSGSAWRIGATAFKAELIRSAPLRRTVLRYLYVLLSQQNNSAVCLRFHLIAPRLARWLLMRQDRARSANFHFTQDFLATMLGVRREGVTHAAGAFQQQGLISYHRGEVQILDREGLKAVACECYSAEGTIYADILG